MPMRKGRSRLIPLAAVTVGLVAVLAGCSATHPAAVRVNADGSVDYVTCVSDADDWYTAVYESEDQEEGVELMPEGQLASSAEGVVVHFAPPEAEWHSMTIGASYFSSVRIYADSFTTDEWKWNNDGWFQGGERCSIGE